ncbi:hypothetical protein FA95DRAFT_1583688 [Auriscalpium vulgare]|uniref:Uncharacterized protein n=1 Tax=Auriscalpium vulgare TaxID=40419 RepID=A0ACB8RKC4_9AGAM|nr:hypothetical protein FA95DRAFT_1583688 [Auriscalpium vulgare]
MTREQDNTDYSVSRAHGPDGLTSAEKRWLEHRDVFEAAGYRFRPRHCCGEFFLDREDGKPYHAGHLLDATRMSDGQQVIMKKIPRREGVQELEIVQYLCSEPYASDPRNHTAQLSEVLSVAEDTVIVIPQLRPYDSPPFQTFGEAVAFFSQIFEGLLYMHELGIAHRDCTHNNIMLDSSRMYPAGFHPNKIDRRRDFKGRAKHYTRTQIRPRYLYIDFGLSQRYGPEDTPLVLPARGGDKTAPEHNDYDTPHDPFPTDVYYLGNLVKERFMAVYRGFEFMDGLINDMTDPDPLKRPKMPEVVDRFKSTRAALSTWKLRARLAKHDEAVVACLWRSVGHYIRSVGYIVGGKAAIPDP